jgi:Delta3-Delta2-enoyl-CoA isomerase
MEDILKTDKHLDLITHEDIHYLVMNQQDNKFSIPWMKDFNALLDKVEATKGPGALVTIATGPKIFHTGFDLDQWKTNQLGQYESFAMCQHLLARLLTFPLPTIAVLSGHTYAGGVFLALAHDFRTMRADYGFVCLSEINLGFPIPCGYTDMLRATLPPNTVREMQYGGRYTAAKAKDLQVVQ